MAILESSDFFLVGCFLRDRKHHLPALWLRLLLRAAGFKPQVSGDGLMESTTLSVSIVTGASDAILHRRSGKTLHIMPACIIL